MGVGQHAEGQIDGIKPFQRFRVRPVATITPEMGGERLVGAATHILADLLLAHGVGGGLKGFHIGGRLRQERDDGSQKSHDPNMSAHNQKIGTRSRLVQSERLS